MPQPILHIVHHKRAGTGRVGRTLRALGYPADVRRPPFGDALPATLEEHAGLVVFGGPMSANDDTGFIPPELQWLEGVVHGEKPVLGICLGGQLLARALGGDVRRHPNGHCEVGWHRIDPAPGAPPVIPEPMYVYQWHSESMSVPPGGELLATSDSFPIQAWRRGNAVGLQFHPEITEAGMRFWVTRVLDRYRGTPGAQPASEQYANHVRHTPTVVRWVRTFLESWVTGRLPEGGSGRHRESGGS